jgi:DNA polymerase-3 subunit alpha
VQGLKLKLGEPMLPSFKVPEGYDAEGYFRHVAREGSSALRGARGAGQDVDREAYRARLETELDVIAKMKFPGYFLIVWDFIRFAKESGVPVGPGRGSGAGSLVAYAMRITDLDPIPYNLLFERFLNPERVSMPDFDIDFCMDRRDEVIAYVQQKYGETSVGQIATFAELKARASSRTSRAASASRRSRRSRSRTSSRERRPPRRTRSPRASRSSPSSRRATRPSPHRELLDQAQKLEGLTRHAGKHAAGIVISEGPLWDHVPVFRDDKSGARYVTQYYKDDVEQAGLVKFDFLGLKTLTVLDIAVRLINARPDFVREARRFDLARIPMDDKRDVQAPRVGRDEGRVPARVERDAAALQGPEGRLLRGHRRRRRPLPPRAARRGDGDDFVNRKHGRAPIAKMHPLVDELLAPTYGVIVYQEQVMQIAQALAGYTLGGADLLRRAMGKKKPEEMAKQKSIFVDGAKKNGVVAGDAERIFGAARVLRRLRLQQEPLGGVRAHHVPDRVAEGALPGRAALRDHDERQGRSRRSCARSPTRARWGHGPAARHQRERHRLQGRLHAPGRRPQAARAGASG